MRKTQWYDGATPPEHIGVYERKLPSGKTSFGTWDGTRWLIGGLTPDLAAENAAHKYRSLVQDCPWRGRIREDRITPFEVAHA